MVPKLFIAFVVALSLSSVGRGDDAKENSADGTWLPTKAELGGQAFPDEVRKSMKLVIKGNKYTVTVGDRVDKGTVKRDPSATPKAVDITGTEGPNKGKTFLAIYERKGDTMRICYDLSGKKRPKEFKTAPDTPLFLVEYRRQK